MKYFVTILAKAKLPTNQYNYLVKTEIVVKFNRSNYPYWVTDNTFGINIYSVNKPKIITAERFRKIILENEMWSRSCGFRSGFRTLQAAEKDIMMRVTSDTIVLEDGENILEV